MKVLNILTTLTSTLILVSATTSPSPTPHSVLPKTASPTPTPPLAQIFKDMMTDLKELNDELEGLEKALIQLSVLLDEAATPPTYFAKLQKSMVVQEKEDRKGFKSRAS